MRAVRAAWSEAVANVLATPARFVLLATVLAVSVLFVGWREATLVRQLDQDLRDRIRAGEFVSVAVGISDEGEPQDISGTACERLAHLGGVVAAGVLRPAGRTTVASHPSGSYQRFEVSPGFLQVVRHQGTPEQALVGSAAATELGLANGSIVASPTVQPRSRSSRRWGLGPHRLIAGLCTSGQPARWPAPAMWSLPRWTTLRLRRSCRACSVNGSRSRLSFAPTPLGRRPPSSIGAASIAGCGLGLRSCQSCQER